MNRHCSEFTEYRRKNIFDKFWKTMNSDQRRVFVASNIEKNITKRKTTNRPCIRQGSYKYTLDNLQVCRQMFLNTLCLGYKTVHAWVDQSFCGMHAEKKNRVDVKQKVKEQHKQQYEILEQFFEQLPKLPAHYCRRDSLKLYLEPHFQSISDVYKLYLTYT